MDWKPRLPNNQELPNDLRSLREWWSHMEQASNRTGRPIAYREDTRQLLEEAGFTDIGHRPIRISLQPGLRDVREANRKRWWLGLMCGNEERDELSFEGLTMSLLTRQLQWTPAGVRALCDNVRAAYMSNQYPLYHTL